VLSTHAICQKSPVLPDGTAAFIFRKALKCYSGVVGCVPIDTQQKISFARLAPNEQPPPPPPKVATPVAVQKPPAPASAPAKPPSKRQPKEKPQDAEQADKLPEFDLQDIPDAMDKKGWPISAKLARKWLASPKHVYNNKIKLTAADRRHDSHSGVGVEISRCILTIQATRSARDIHGESC